MRRGTVPSLLALAALVVLVSPAAGSRAAGPHPHALGGAVRVEQTVTLEVPFSFWEGQPYGSMPLSCQPGYSLLSAGNEVLEGHVWVYATQGPTSAQFSFANRSRSEFARVKLYIDCIPKSVAPVRDSAPSGHTHQVQTKVVTEKRTIQPGGVVEVAGACPKDSFAAAGGIAPGTDAVTLLRSMPSDGHWSYEAVNVGKKSADAGFSTRCIAKQTEQWVPPKAKKKAKKRWWKKHRHAVRSTVVKKTVEVPSSPAPRQDGVDVSTTIACPTGSTATGLGFDTNGHPFNQPEAWWEQSPLNPANGVLFRNFSTEGAVDLAQVCAFLRTGKAG